MHKGWKSGMVAVEGNRFIVHKAEHGPLPPGLGNLPQGTDSGKSHTRIPR